MYIDLKLCWSLFRMASCSFMAGFACRCFCLGNWFVEGCWLQMMNGFNVLITHISWTFSRLLPEICCSVIAVYFFFVVLDAKYCYKMSPVKMNSIAVGVTLTVVLILVLGSLYSRRVNLIKEVGWRSNIIVCVLLPTIVLLRLNTDLIGVKVSRRRPDDMIPTINKLKNE